MSFHASCSPALSGVVPLSAINLIITCANFGRFPRGRSSSPGVLKSMENRVCF
jgi:hypothetical protein